MTSVLPGSAGSQVQDVAEVVAGLRRTFASRRTRAIGWRLEQLDAIERLVTERESEIAEALAADQGRTAHYAWLGEVAPTVAEAAFARKHLRRWMRKQRTGLPLSMLPGRAEYRYEPLGVVLVIGPWNYPVYLTLSPLVAAVAAGNCAVLKPSEHTPATSALLARLIPQYLDPAAVAVVEGAADATQALLAQAMDHVLFTGGPEIGRRILEGAAPHLTPVTLELGGKCPAIVAADADIPVAARRIAWMKLLNSGQTCIAPDYALVDSRVRDEFLATLTATIEEFQVGEPAGRIIDARQFDRLSRLLDGHGGTLLRGGSLDREALTLDPAVVLDPDPDSALMQEEIFGPVLPVVTTSSLDDALRRINSGPKPLAAYLFGSSRSDRERLLNETSSGGVVINHAAMHCLIPQLPFGGVGHSGMGAYHGRWGFETFSHRKAVLVKPAKPDPSVMYPPYTESKKKLMRRFF
ncbi:aldehyde dehydrogenase family protein [Pseudonocardia sp. NPDC049154]|uniref:aldehyde dehydrogenase family protein n=1 Tax=Pseudonocardia sp. NPDC049154 TaxID=3155501 RepID=UPI00340B20B1